MPHFVMPSTDVFLNPGVGDRYAADAATYSHYNYLKPGWVARVKRGRFETSLELASPWFGTRIVDMGCADGILLPSLSRHFAEVLAVDVHPTFCDIARRVVEREGLANVRVIQNAGADLADVRGALGAERYDAMMLLETLEHVGAPATMYADKVRFLEECFTLLGPGGVVVVSVPRMVGPQFLAKYAVQAAMGRVDERHSLGELWRAGVLLDTRALEPKYRNGHLGFNHRTLESALGGRFAVLRRHGSLTSVFWVLARRGEEAAARAPRRAAPAPARAVPASASA